MFEFITLPVIVTSIVFLVIGAFIGVGLGRRSKTANDFYDRGREELDKAQRRADELEAQLRIAMNKLKDNGL